MIAKHSPKKNARNISSIHKKMHMTSKISIEGQWNGQTTDGEDVLVYKSYTIIY